MKMGNVSSVSPGLVTDVIAILESVSSVKAAKEALGEISDQLKEYYALVEKNSLIASENEAVLKEISEKKAANDKLMLELNTEAEKIEEKRNKLKEESEINAVKKKHLESEDERLKAIGEKVYKESKAVESAAAIAMKTALDKEEAADALAKEYSDKLDKLKSIMGEK